VAVRGSVVNRGTETARGLWFHFDLLPTSEQPSQDTEKNVWNSFSGQIGGASKQTNNDLGATDDRYADAETARLTTFDANALNAGRATMYFVGYAQYRDSVGPLFTEMCFFWDPGGVWRRCSQYNRVGVSLFKP
jgi:hypothetical protein